MRGPTARFHVPADAKDIWLVSPTARPCDTKGTEDGRDLGVCIASLRVEDGFAASREIAIDDPLLCNGFHAVEEGVRRWTTARAQLPTALWEDGKDGFYLCLDLAGKPVPRWRPQSRMPRAGAIDDAVRRPERSRRLVTRAAGATLDR